MWGLIIALGTLALAIGGAIVAFGKFQGKVGEKADRHEKDIDGLWQHQRQQDSRCSVQTAETAQIMAGLKATLEAVATSTAETRHDVKEIRNMVIDRGK
jgi:uncharacterized protein HemX